MSNFNSGYNNPSFGNHGAGNFMVGGTIDRQQQVEVTRFVLIETGTYNEQVSRPYETNVDGSVINALQERFSTSSHFDSAGLAGIANQFIAPSATPEAKVDIINGWSERRFRFMMEVQTKTKMGTTIEEVLGYTNNLGATLSGAIDPQMEFFINSVVTIRITRATSPLGHTQEYRNTVDCSQILVDDNWSGLYGDKLFKMRPTDVFATMTRTGLQEYMPNGGDTRNMLTSAPIKARRSSNLAPVFAASILDMYQKSQSMAEFGQSEDEIISKARDFAQEQLVSADPFIRAISNIQGESTMVRSFRLVDLKRLDPGCDRDGIMKVFLLGQAQKAQVHTVGETQDWCGSDRYTQVATILAQSIPAIISKYGLTGIQFSTTNNTMGCMVYTEVTDYQSFSNRDMSEAIQFFKARLEHEVMRDITYSGQVTINLRMRCDLTGETTIVLNIDGQGDVPYTVPSFSDALFTPLVTHHDSKTLNLSMDFQNIFASVIDSGGISTPMPKSNFNSGFNF